MALLQIGVMLEEVQLADIACIDLLSNISSDTRDILGQFAPPDLAANAVEMMFHYISSTLEPTNMTPSIKVIPTVTYDDAPRDLDILLIGGPLPSHRPTTADKFMKEAIKGDLVSGTLVVDDSRLAYFGKTENNSPPGRLHLDVPYTEPTVKHLLLEFKDKATIHYCIPVKRRITTENIDEDDDITEPKPTTTTIRPKTAGKKYLAIAKKKNKRQRRNTCLASTEEPKHKP